MIERKEEVKITIIDDEKELVATIKEFLEARGFIINFAYGGKAGLKLVRSEPPDIIVLDISMPDMDGRDVLVELKKDEETKNIPVIMLTGRTEQFDRDYGIELGAQEYMTKPYRGHLLLRQIENILNKKDKDEA